MDESFSLTFSPSGKLVRIEHDLTVVASGQTSLGITGTIFAYGVISSGKTRTMHGCNCDREEALVPSILVDETSVQKIQVLTPNIGVVYSGMGPDSRVLVRTSRKQADQYLLLFKEPNPVTQLRETDADINGIFELKIFNHSQKRQSTSDEDDDEEGNEDED